MLCSVPAGKSSSSWLDRLRSTKGFPTAPDFGLDHFLSASRTPAPSTSELIQTVEHRETSQTPTLAENPRDECYGIITSILSELFHMGDPGPLLAKKSSRKQANPRFFPGSSGDEEDCLRKDDNALSFNSDNFLVEKAGKLACPDEEEDDEEKELVGYSRSEVTVIDTSCPGWKFEKLLHRRKNVWKVRDRKGKGKSELGRKKRRASGAGANEIIRGKKKLKLSNDSSNEGHYATLNGKKEEFAKMASNLCQRPQMRIPVSGSSIKLRNGSSSVVLIKGISAGKRKKADIWKSSIKQ